MCIFGILLRTSYWAHLVFNFEIPSMLLTKGYLTLTWTFRVTESSLFHKLDYFISLIIRILFFMLNTESYLCNFLCPKASIWLLATYFYFEISLVSIPTHKMPRFPFRNCISSAVYGFQRRRWGACFPQWKQRAHPSFPCLHKTRHRYVS